MGSPSPFSFGSTICPGLAKAGEEAGEVCEVAAQVIAEVIRVAGRTVQVIGKAVMIGGLGDHFDGTNLKVRLEEETGDFLAAAEFMQRHGVIDRTAVTLRKAQKLDLYEKWHAEQAAPEGAGPAFHDCAMTDNCRCHGRPGQRDCAYLDRRVSAAAAENRRLEQLLKP